MAEGMAAVEHIFVYSHEAETMNWKGGWGFKLSRLASCNAFPPARLHFAITSPHSTLQWGSSIQMSEPMGIFLFQSTTTVFLWRPSCYRQIPPLLLYKYPPIWYTWQVETGKHKYKGLVILLRVYQIQNWRKLESEEDYWSKDIFANYLNVRSKWSILKYVEVNIRN